MDYVSLAVLALLAMAVSFRMRGLSAADNRERATRESALYKVGMIAAYSTATLSVFIALLLIFEVYQSDAYILFMVVGLILAVMTVATLFSWRLMERRKRA